MERSLKRKAKGERPYFFDDNNIDKLVSMIMGLAGETSVLMERLDTIEKILAEKAIIQKEEIEQFVPSKEVLLERAQRREVFLSEILRILEIELEANALKDNKPYESAVREVEQV